MFFLPSDGRAFANMHGVPFIEASTDGPSPASPFPALLHLVTQSYGAPVPASYRESVVDFLTVAAAKVSHAARTHLHTTLPTTLPLTTREYPPRVQRRKFPGSFSAPRCGSFSLPRAWHFPRIPRFQLGWPRVFASRLS
jgi:hypothetical protein